MPREAPVTRAMREARGRVMELALSIVVPANAGTHTPCRQWLRKVGIAFASHQRKAGGYGSPRSRGRQLARLRQQRQLPWLRLDLGLVGEVGRIGAGEAV